MGPLFCWICIFLSYNLDLSKNKVFSSNHSRLLIKSTSDPRVYILLRIPELRLARRVYTYHFDSLHKPEPILDPIEDLCRKLPRVFCSLHFNRFSKNNLLLRTALCSLQIIIYFSAHPLFVVKSLIYLFFWDFW